MKGEKSPSCCFLQEIKKNAEKGAFHQLSHQQDVCFTPFEQGIKLPPTLADSTLEAVSNPGLAFESPGELDF